MTLTPQEAEAILRQYAAFEPFTADEAKAHVVWKVDEIVDALRKGALPSATRKIVDDAVKEGPAGEPPALKARIYPGRGGGWHIFREDLLVWLVEELIPGYARKTG